MRTKVIECKAPQHEFLATYLDVEPEKNVHHAQRQKEHKKEGSLDHEFCPLSRVMSIDLQNMVALEMVTAVMDRMFDRVLAGRLLGRDLAGLRSRVTPTK